MEQHPIPQQISTYQFRLVGDMTLKQFFQIAGGALVSLLIYSLPIHPIIKWPLIVFFFGLGAALAFLPFQERPLESWIVAFFRSVYSPTLYTWDTTTTKLNLFAPETDTTQAQIGGQSTAKSSSNLPFMSNLENAESAFLTKLGTLFSANPTQPVINQPQQAQNPAPVAASFSVPTPINQTIAPSPSTTPIVELNIPRMTPEVRVPQTTPVAIPVNPRPNIFVQETPSTTNQPIQVGPNQPVPLVVQPTPQVANPSAPTAQVAQFSNEAATPMTPEKPNTLSGQIMDSSGKIIEGAIIEIQDEQARPVRALRSNKAGHFLSVTPLLSGHYTIITEKDGLTFDPITIEARGEIIQPIAIHAKNSLVVS